MLDTAYFSLMVEAEMMFKM